MGFFCGFGRESLASALHRGWWEFGPGVWPGIGRTGRHAERVPVPFPPTTMCAGALSSEVPGASGAGACCGLSSRDSGRGVCVGENTGVHATPYPVSLRRAARRAGLSVEEFQAAVDPLNGTPEDLRVPGSRQPARYDPERLARWIQAFRLPDQPLTEPSVDAAVPVIARWTGSGWVLSAPKTGFQARAARLVTARRKMAHLLAPVVEKQPSEVELVLSWDLDPAAMQLWSESLEFKDLARQLLTLAAHKRHCDADWSGNDGPGNRSCTGSKSPTGPAAAGP